MNRRTPQARAMWRGVAGRRAGVGARFGGLLAILCVAASCSFGAGRASPPATTGATPARLRVATLPNGDFVPLVVHFANPEDGWIGGGRGGQCAGGPCAGAVLGTTDGGRTWRRLYQGSVVPYAVDDLGAGRGWFSGQVCPASPLRPCRGSLLATADGGRTWRTLYRAAVPITAVSFVSGRAGWIATAPCAAGCTGGQVLRTTDGGIHWRVAGSPCPPSWTLAPVGGLAFLSAHAGYALCVGRAGASGEEKLLRVTADGGATWNTRSATTPPGGVAGAGGSRPGALQLGGYGEGLAFATAADGWIALAAGAALHTTDGGLTWRRLALPGYGQAFSVTGLAAQGPAGLVVVEGIAGEGVVLRSRDAGATWTDLYPPLRPLALLGAGATPLAFVDGRTGFAGGDPFDAGGILETADGGASWREAARLPGAAVMSVSFPSAEDGWAAVLPRGGGSKPGGALWRTTDGGASWHPVAGLPVRAAAWVQFVDPSHGFVAGGGGLFATADGGAVFRRVATLPAGATPLAFASRTVGFAVRPTASGSVLLRTVDGGRHWASVAGAPQLDSLAFADPSHVWGVGRACGGYGAGCGVALFRSVDGGHTWRRVDLGPATPLGVTFAGTQDGWVTTDGGHGFATTDGGANWTQRW